MKISLDIPTNPCYNKTTGTAGTSIEGANCLTHFIKKEIVR